MYRSKLLLAALAGGLLGLLNCGADAQPAKTDPPKAEPASLIVIDGAGKEQKLKSYKFIQGTRRLAWLAPPGEEPESKPKEPAKEGARPKVARLGQASAPRPWRSAMKTRPRLSMASSP